MFFLILGAALLPAQVLIATPRGQVNVPVATERGAAVAAVLLTPTLGLSASIDGAAVQVTLGGRSFQFNLGAPFVHCDSGTYPLVDAPYTARDTLFLPLQWLTDHVPRLFGGRYHWDPALARLDEIPPPIPPAPAVAGTPNPLTGLRLAHTIVVDPGHGGIDPGNPGLHFPRGLTEKDITLGISRLLRAELVRRGLTVVLTRAVDSLIDLADRPTFCRAECDLFVSIHVNAMPPGRRQSKVNGVETYFLSDAKTEDQKRVAEMENDALRFEAAPTADGDGPLGFILRDLQLNEYLRESARLAELVQGRVARVHPGDDRGVQQAPFLVLAAARRPAILVETGFATNKRDGAFLASPGGQQRIAIAIADAIVSYLAEFERKLAVGGGPAR